MAPVNAFIYATALLVALWSLLADEMNISSKRSIKYPL
jgi:hypothetical protein